MALNGGARERFALPGAIGMFSADLTRQADCSVPGFFFATSFEAATRRHRRGTHKLSPMLSESSPWKGIFTRRSSADRAKPPKRGDPNASLRELALQQVLELDATAEVPTLTVIPILTRCWSRARSDAAAEAPLDDLREIASVIALWPPACLPWVLPRLGHRLLFACFFDSDLRSLVSAELLEAAIRVRRAALTSCVSTARRVHAFATPLRAGCRACGRGHRRRGVAGGGRRRA
jgi:hypothetical protein